MKNEELLTRVKDDGVKFVSFQFTDINGTVKSVDSPVDQLADALESGIWFGGGTAEFGAAIGGTIRLYKRAD